MDTRVFHVVLPSKLHFVISSIITTAVLLGFQHPAADAITLASLPAINIALKIRMNHSAENNGAMIVFCLQDKQKEKIDKMLGEEMNSCRGGKNRCIFQTLTFSGLI